jgi:hypothetical protein
VGRLLLHDSTTPTSRLNDVATCRTGSNTFSERPICGGGTLIEAIDRRHNAADPNESYIDPDLDPMELREWQAGADRQLGTNMRVGLRYIHKEVVKAIEDVGILIPGVGEVYYIANPGYGLTTSIAAQPFPKAVRDYDAAELTFERRFTDRWGVSASYTYSKLWGNYTGLASGEEQNTVGVGARLSPNVSRQFDVVQSSYDKNGEFTYGRLASDRPHQFKAQFMYQFPWQTDDRGEPVHRFGHSEIGDRARSHPQLLHAERARKPGTDAHPHPDRPLSHP